MAGKKVESFDLGIYSPTTIVDGTGASQTAMEPVNAGLVYAYDDGTTSNQTVYSDVGLTTPLAQPFTLDSNGRAEVYVANDIVKFVIKDSLDVATIRTMDHIDGQRSTFVDNITFSGTVTFGSTFGFADGTATTPGIGFSSDTNTGFYRIGSDNFAAVAGGVSILDIDGTGIEAKKRIETIAGTVAAPSIVNASDTDTGIYFSAAETVSIASGGVKIAEFTSVGFQPLFQIRAIDGTSANPSYSWESDINTGMYHSGTNGSFYLNSSGSLQVRVTGSGVVFYNGIDSGNYGIYLKKKMLSIGDWNMDTTGAITVGHGLTLSKIRSVTGYILDDASTTSYPITNGPPTGAVVADVEITAWDSSNVTLTRLSGGTFDSTNFDSTSFNRGHLIIVSES